jgi:hypothetical protein
MTEQSSPERIRAEWPSVLWGLGTGAFATTAAWIVAFGILHIYSWSGSVLEMSAQSLGLLPKIAKEFFILYGMWEPLSSNDVAIATLEHENALSQYVGRVVIALIAGLFVADTLRRWRYERTLRRQLGQWPAKTIPSWSEGKDAIANANAMMTPSTLRTGRGLEIAPGVALSKEIEARPILLAGDPGGGKTVAVWQLIPQLLERPDAQLIVHDTKGDMTARWPSEFILLAPHDVRSFGWDIGADVTDETTARELAAQLIANSERAPHWPNGAQEILVGAIRTLQTEHAANWGWADLKAALDLHDPDLREFATRHHPAAARFLALDETGNFTLNAGSFVSTLMAPINKLVAPLAEAWGDLAPQYRLSLKKWLDEPAPDRRVVIFQRAPDQPDMSKAWIGAAVKFVSLHLLATRQDRNPANKTSDRQADIWFLLDEFPQIGLNPNSFLPILEVGRSLGLRCIIGIQNFDQMKRFGDGDFGQQLLQFAGTVLAFAMNPGPDAAKICEGRLTKAKIKQWRKQIIDGKRQTHAIDVEIPILCQADLADLALTRDGAQGYLIYKNAAFGLTWSFAENPDQRPGTKRARRPQEGRPG